MEYEQLTLFPIGDNIEEPAKPEYLESAAPNKSDNGKNLITLALPSRTISIEGTAERYGHGQTPHSMHVWWGRRPLSAMRAIILATLAKVESGKTRAELLNLCDAVAKFQPYPKTAIDKASSVLGKDKSVVDLFGGGGTISLEAAKLGCQAISVELNPLATFVEKTLLVYSQKVTNLSQLVEDWGKILLNQLKADTEELWNGGVNGGQPASYFWARGISCPNCGLNIPVKPLFLLKSRPQEKVYASSDTSSRNQVIYN
ncbi:DUF1156 domain-containing protein [[Phormidium] sp. ETS-05]|uniref:DUF1156 domain-containing protein n=1 Tax=[Phormidium] sp. ETS-05 TaxID=222819 RepID=UPI0018EF2B38|nr:DUF1156 domain-containing protein [[Phormidium] sp. ETS-05]